MLFSHHVICLYLSLWQILVEWDQDLSDLNFTQEKRGEESTHSVTISSLVYCCLLRHVSLGVATSPFQPDLPDALERLVGLPERRRPFRGHAPCGSTASVRKKGSRTRNQANLPAFVSRFKFKHKFAFSSLWARTCQHADQRIVSIPTFLTWAVKTRQIINHPKLSG